MAASCLPAPLWAYRGRQGRAAALKCLTYKASCAWIKFSSLWDCKTHLQAYIYSVASLPMNFKKCGYLCHLGTILYSTRLLRIRLRSSNGLSWWWQIFTGWLYITWMAGDEGNIASDLHQFWNDQVIGLTQMPHIWAVAFICCLIHGLSNSQQLRK